MSDDRTTIRLDKWLWFARFFKTRTLSARTVSQGHVRVNGTRVDKPSIAVGGGDALTFAQGRRVRVVEIIATGTRRGPAIEAQTLYRDLSPEMPTALRLEAVGRMGRPSKRERRDAVALKRKLPE